MGPAIYFVFHGEIAGHLPCATYPLEAVKKFAEEYKGTPVEEVTYNNIKYYKTVFDYGGQQALLQTKIMGSCIHIKLAGRDVLTNPAVNEILNTVSFKLPQPKPSEMRD